jgi:RHS repeat-associated protein
LTGTFRYTGRRLDPETGGGTVEPSGLYYYRARTYSPTLGRFLQPDPIGYTAGNNLYAYVGNDPLNMTDSSGLDALLGQHSAIFPGDPFYHGVIVLRPDNPSDFADNPLFGVTQGREATLGAQAFGGSISLGRPLGNLHSTPNYPSDAPANLPNLTRIEKPPGMTDTQFIQSLISAANSYQNNAPYNMFPSASGGDYNSNSFVAGVIGATGAIAPALSGAMPGYDKPLPLSTPTPPAPK